jgi:hypothetical protein
VSAGRFLLAAAALVVFAAMPIAPAGASPTPAPVKYFVVPPPGHGPAESLYTIAADTLGDGSDWTEIFRLNEGRLQPDGERLTNPGVIRPGWILQLPADAAGPGVRTGLLPGVAPSPSVASPTPAAAPSAAPRGPSVVMLGGIVALLASLTAVLAFGLIRQRRGYHGHHRVTQPALPHHVQLLPATKPVAAPKTEEPAANPKSRPIAKGRQFAAMRLTVIAAGALLLFALISGTTEVALHGFSFFVFRSQGVGATPDSGLNEAQGPGQPDAPGSKVTCAQNSAGTCAGPVLPRVTPHPAVHPRTRKAKHG